MSPYRQKELTQTASALFLLIFYVFQTQENYFLKLSFKDTLRLNTRFSGVESLLSRQK